MCQIYGKTTVVSTEYIYQVPENVSPDQARETALTRARAQAIADEFGMTVNQVTSVTVENNNGNSSSDFLSMGGSELKGEWIEDLEAPVFEYITDGANIAIKVKIKGRIRETKGSKVSVSTKILRNGTADSHEADQFVSGDDLYVSFSSPVDGYTAIYLVDNADNAFCLLPYQAQTDGIFKTKGNQKYLFFHPDHSHGIRPADVDRIVVDTELERERNRILILFSPNKFYKGADEKQSADLP
ncbi:MAG: DUF4384 domain-containing protein, partial [Duncaniella sp.]|nr:DUF4384 domain-containing protein [Duncaniella sp.]